MVEMMWVWVVTPSLRMIALTCFFELKGTELKGTGPKGIKGKGIKRN